jgi:hypothetical protein
MVKTPVVLPSLPKHLCHFAGLAALAACWKCFGKLSLTF